jgi:fatty-acid desaturase
MTNASGKGVASAIGIFTNFVTFIYRMFMSAYLLSLFYHECTFRLAILCLLSCMWRVFVNHGGGHRYFSHKSFDCHPWFAQFLALSIMASSLGSFFYWCLLHNHHHAHCDEGQDIHSPRVQGFWAVQLNLYSDARMTELLVERSTSKEGRDIMKSNYAADFSWANPKWNAIILLFETAMWLILSVGLGYRPFELYLYAVLLPRLYTMIVLQLTNSAAHTFGPSPYCGREGTYFPRCHATNCWWVSLLNGGEGWHSNHHAYAKSARHGLLWWELDTVYITLNVLGYMGLIWNLTTVHDDVRLLERYTSKCPPAKYVQHFRRGGQEDEDSKIK